METELERFLLALLGDPGSIAGQADKVQAATLNRQELSFRQRAGAAAAQLRLARSEGADPAELAELEARLAARMTRLIAARTQAAAADIKRPAPDFKSAQVFGRALGSAEKPPVTAAILNEKGEPLATTVVGDNGSFHLTAGADLLAVRFQLSDAAGRVLSRSATPVDIPAGTVHYLDVTLSAPKPEPGPVPSGAQMPDLVGQSEGVAVVVLSRLGIENVTIRDLVVKDQTPGNVVRQIPEAGAPLPLDAKVVLTVGRVSDRSTPKTLPDLHGLSFADAEAALTKLGLKATVTRQPDDGPAETVLSQKPEAGASLTDLKTVDLTVSATRDAPPDAVFVPDLIGKTGDLAQELLKAAKLRAEVTQTADPAGPFGVTAQDPAAGVSVKFKTVVKLTLNEPPKTDPGLVVMPALTGRNIDVATKLLERLALKAEVSTTPNPAPKGEVLTQDPLPRAKVATTQGVKLTVSSGPATTTTKADLAELSRKIAADPKAVEAGFTDKRLATLFRTGRVAQPEDARALTTLDPEDLAERLKLKSLDEAVLLQRLILVALKDLG